MGEVQKFKCFCCKDTGIEEYFEIDGQTIYSWMKPKKRKCKYCKPAPAKQPSED